MTKLHVPTSYYFAQHLCPECSKPIAGIHERLYCTAWLSPDEHKPNEPKLYQYSGMTDVHWDSQEPDTEPSQGFPNKRWVLVQCEDEHVWKTAMYDVAINDTDAIHEHLAELVEASLGTTHALGAGYHYFTKSRLLLAMMEYATKEAERIDAERRARMTGDDADDYGC